MVFRFGISDVDLVKRGYLEKILFKTENVAPHQAVASRSSSQNLTAGAPCISERVRDRKKWFSDSESAMSI